MSEQMTKADVRRAVAVALGATITTEQRKIYTYHVITWQGKRVGIALTVIDAWRKAFESGAIPDWPNDPGAAPLLCRDVLDRLNASETDPGMQRAAWEFTLDAVSVHFKCWKLGGIVADYWQEGRDPESMSRLALAALEAQAVNA